MIKTIICDDESASIDIIQIYVKEENPMIEIVGTARNGLDALKLIMDKSPEIVFMDIHMPFLNGLEVIEKVLKEKVETKFIIITAYESFEYARQALKLGAVDILPKPVDFKQLGEAVNQAIGFQFTACNVVNQALDYIHGHYYEEIRLVKLSEIAYCTESHLSREFKKHMGETILSYIHRFRVDKAISLMLKGQLSIQEISEKVGYLNVNNFYKYFKEFKGRTPGVYMNELHAK